jgi:hypothetical protein
MRENDPERYKALCRERNRRKRLREAPAQCTPVHPDISKHGYNRYHNAKKKGFTVEQYLQKKLDKHVAYKKRQREQKRAQRKRRAAENAAFVWEYKSTHPCKCGVSHPACIDFHHKDPATKDRGISDLVSGGLSHSRLLKEIAKCDILCSNCHRKLHWEDSQKSAA